MGKNLKLIEQQPNRYSPSRVKGSPKRRGVTGRKGSGDNVLLEIIHLFFLNLIGWHSIWYPLRESVRDAIKSFQSHIAAAPPSRRMNRHGNRATTDRANQLTPNTGVLHPWAKAIAGNLQAACAGAKTCW